MNQSKHRFAVLLLASFAVVLAPVWARADFSGFGDFSGFKINQNDGQSAPTVTISPNPLNSTIHLTGPGFFESRSIFDKTPQPTSAHFTASFTYQETGPSDVAGFAFVLQNSGAGFNAVGGNENGLGYSGIGSSEAVEFILFSPFTTGLFANGNVGAGSNSISPVSLLTGHPINVNINYDGAILRETVTDMVTLVSSPTLLIPVQLPSTAYVGLTAGTDNGVDQLFSNFQFTTTNIPEPSSLVLAGAGAAGLLGLGRRHTGRGKCDATRSCTA